MSADRSPLVTSLGDRRRAVLLASLLFCGHQAGEALVPLLVGVVVDRALAPDDPRALLLWLAVLAVDFAVLSTCYRLGARRAFVAEAHVDRALRLRVATRVLHPRGGAEAGRLPGGLVGIATTDAGRTAAVAAALPLGIAAVAAMVVTAVALLTISWPLGLLVLLGTPVLLAAVHLLGRPLERRSGPEQERAAAASGVAADLVAGLRVLKGLRAEDAAVRRYVAASRGALAATLSATRAQAGYQGAVLAANGLFLALVALVGGRLAADGAITVGELVSAVGLAQFLVTPLQIAGWAGGRLAQGRASSARLAELLRSPHAVGPGAPHAVRDDAGALVVTGLRHDVLDGLGFRVGDGEVLGVVAPDPGVARALVRCLAREIDPDAGSVALGDTDLATLDPQEARRRVLVAAHDADLFAGTVAENVAAAASPSVHLPRVLAAARADQVAGALPDGAASEVGDQGRALSGGQRQRLVLARALATDPPVLVLHDPTTAVDTVTEAGIAEGLRALRAGRTTVLVTTSATLLAVTDRVVLLDARCVVVEGTHAALLAGDDAYRTAVRE